MSSKLKPPKRSAPAIVTGVRAIAEVIDRTPRATYHALERGQIPGAARFGRRWSLNLDIFNRAFAA
jgi:hypothetical protein